MNKKAGIGIAAAIVVAGTLGTSYYMGGRLEQGFTARMSQLNANGLSVKVVNYERGAFSSTAKTVWTLEDSSDGPIQFTADHKISHGPLPMGHAAQIHTSFQLPSEADDGLKTALNGRSPLEVESKIGWNRSSSNVMTSPAVTAKLKESELTWGGMNVEWDMPADMKGIKGTANFAALQFKDDEGSVAVDKTQMRFDAKQPAGQKFWIGPFAMTIGQVIVTQVEDDNGKSSSSSFEDFSMVSDSTLKGDIVEMTLKSSLQSAKLPDAKASDILLDISFHNLDASWVNDIIDMSRRKPQTTESAEEGAAEIPSDLRERLMKNLTQALARQPSININRLSMRTESGVSEFGASAAYIGNGEDMSNPFKDIKISIKADVPQKAMDDFLLKRKRSSLLSMFEDESVYDAKEIEATAKEQAQASLQALKEHGILVAKDGKLNTEIVYANGEIQVNGKILEGEGTAVLMGEAL